MMAYNVAFWFSFLLWVGEIAFFYSGAMAFIKYISKRDR